MKIIEENIDVIKSLCENHGVSSLFVFGSILSDKFNNSSDIDFLVAFKGIDVFNYADNYFRLKESLESLLKRQIDLLEDNAIKNPYLRHSIDTSKQKIYG